MPVIINGDIINDADDRASEWRENRREEEENGTEWDFSEEETEEDTDWEEDEEEDDDELIESDNGGSTTTTTRTRVPKRPRECDSASESEEEEEQDENGNVPGLIVDDDEEIAENNDGAAAVDVSNVVSTKRRRISPTRFVAEPAEVPRPEKWNSFKEMADELNKMNKCKPNHALCDHYKSILMDALAETPSVGLSASTGWLKAVREMPAHRKLTKWKKKLFAHLHKEWLEEAKRVHFNKMVKIAQLTRM